MLQEEESIEQTLAPLLVKGEMQPVYTPLGMEEAAAQLQQYLDDGSL